MKSQRVASLTGFLTAVAIMAALVTPAAAAPIPVTGTMTYTQDFDSLGPGPVPWTDDSTLPGWYAQMNNGLTASGTLQPGNGTNGNLNGLLNLGAPGSADRALGSKATGTSNMANIAFAVQFRNMTGKTIAFTRLAFTGELWRTNSSAGTAERFYTSYATSPTRIYHIISGPSAPDPVYGEGFYANGSTEDWTGPVTSPASTPLDGNAAANRAVITYEPQWFFIAPGHYFMIKWTDTNPAGTDGHQGLDDISVSFRTLDFPGDLDTSFNATISQESGSTLTGVAMQPDGRLLMSGSFGTVNSFARPYCARLYPDGSLDAAFQPAIAYNRLTDGVHSACLLDDGNILLAGQFTTAGSLVRTDLVRLHSDGVFDAGFIADTDGRANVTALHSNGALFIGGQFNQLNLTPAVNLAATDANGGLLSQPAAPVNGTVRTMALQPDGKLLIGGSFNSVAGQSRPLIARLHADGALDTGFNVNLDYFQHGTSAISCLALQADGRILASGLVTGVQSQYILFARFHTDGTRDSSFNAPPGVKSSILVQTDGRIITTGSSSNPDGVKRFHSDGSLDTGFVRMVEGGISGAVLQDDGRIVIGGSFQKVWPADSTGLARLLNSPATQSLAPWGVTTVHWMRGGSSPETHFVSFDFSPDADGPWTPLGPGTRVAGGWERTGLSLPSSGHLRARARIAGGASNASSGLVETIAPYTLTPVQLWRYQHFAAGETAPEAGNEADADHDGLANLVEFAFGLNPREPDSHSLPAWQMDDADYRLSFTLPEGVAGVSCFAEYSYDLAPGTWLSVPNLAEPPEYNFYAPFVTEGRLFLRVRVTSP